MVPSPFPLLEGEAGERAPGGQAVVVGCLGIVGAAALAGADNERAFVWPPLWRCCPQLQAGGRELWSGRKIPLPFPSPKSGLRGLSRCSLRGLKRARSEWRPGPLPPLFIVRWGITVPGASAPLLSILTGLRPHWFDCLAFPCVHPSWPRPGPFRSSSALVSGPLLLDFRLTTEGPLLTFRGAVPTDPFLPGEAFRVLGGGAVLAKVVPSSFFLLGAPLPC